MKKYMMYILALLLLTAFCLAGCKSAEVSNVEAAIEKIGTVTLDSAEDIQAAREAYDALSAEDQNAVDNYQRLEEAEEAFVKLETEYAEAAIDAIGEVTIDSEDQIRAAWDALESVSPTAYANVRNLDVLLKADDAFAALQESAVAQDVKGLLDQGNYEGAVSVVSSYCDEHDLQNASEETVAQFVQAYLALANYYESSSELERAENTLKSFDGNYTFSAGNPIADALNALQARIAAKEPANGAVLQGNCSGGYAEIKIENGGSAALIKLESVSDPSVYLTMYVRANQTASVHVVDGTYRLKYATGERWYSEAELFGQNTQYTKADQDVVLTTTYSGNSVSYSSITITLYQVLNGNLSTSSISENDF